MSDNSMGIVTALYLQSEAQRKAGEAQIAAQNRQSALREANNEIAEQNAAMSDANLDLEGSNAVLRRKNHNILVEFGKEREYRNKVVREHNRLLEENKYYKSLLCKPMLEIAEASGDFKKTYEEQMAFIADWMVSQKAFKELAIELGEKQGMTPEEVIEMGLDKKIDVLEDRHDPKHNTNAGDGNTIAPRKAKLIEKYHKDKAARKSNKSS